MNIQDNCMITAATVDITQCNWFLIFHIVDRLRCVEALCQTKCQGWFKDKSNNLHIQNLHPLDIAVWAEKEFQLDTNEVNKQLFETLEQNREIGTSFCQLLKLPCYYGCLQPCLEIHRGENQLLLLEACFNKKCWLPFGKDILISKPLSESHDWDTKLHFLINKNNGQVWWCEVVKTSWGVMSATKPRMFNAVLSAMACDFVQGLGIACNKAISLQNIAMENIFHQLTDHWLVTPSQHIPKKCKEHLLLVFPLASLFNWCVQYKQTGHMLHPLGRYNCQTQRDHNHSKKQHQNIQYKPQASLSPVE